MVHTVGIRVACTYWRETGGSKRSFIEHSSSLFRSDIIAACRSLTSETLKSPKITSLLLCLALFLSSFLISPLHRFIAPVNRRKKIMLHALAGANMTTSPATPALLPPSWIVFRLFGDILSSMTNLKPQYATDRRTTDRSVWGLRLLNASFVDYGDKFRVRVVILVYARICVQKVRDKVPVQLSACNVRTCLLAGHFS